MPNRPEEQKHFYPRSPYGERPYQCQIDQKSRSISIHALLTESDELRSAYYSPSPNFYPRSPYGERQLRGHATTARPYISIHALLTESDCFGRTMSVLNGLFLSTLSLRRATPSITGYFLDTMHFYPRSPYGERLPLKSESLTTYLISIHALLTESDSVRSQPSKPRCLFLSTLSLRRATTDWVPEFPKLYISIHALLTESDNIINSNSNFTQISIHALLTESDSKSAQNSGALLRI